MIVLGDFNVQSVRWLRHSARESIEGRTLFEMSCKLGFKQLVKEPTRGEYLLDLLLTDLEDCAAKPWHVVADHKRVLTRVNFKVPETAAHQREISHFTDDDWKD